MLKERRPVGYRCSSPAHPARSLCLALSRSLPGSTSRSKGHVSSHDEKIGLEPWELRRAAQNSAGCDVGRVPKLREALSHPLLRVGIDLSVGIGQSGN